MPTTFWTTAGSKLAEQWLARVVTPAFLYWTIGALLLARRGPAGFRSAVDAVVVDVAALPAVLQGLFLGAVLLIVVASASLVERLTVPTTRLLEGYWSWPFGMIGVRLARRRTASRARAGREFSDLRAELSRRSAGVELEHTAQQRAALDRAERSVRRAPARAERAMPTRFGNVLRAAEERPRERYGLDPIAVWDQLWLVLPSDARDPLLAARAGLDNAVRTWLWCALLSVWTIWTWWMLPLSILLAWIVYCGWLLDTAEVYGDIMSAAFDVHRIALYKAVGFDLPSDPDNENDAGAALTQYLWRGTAPPGTTLSW